MAMVNNLHWGEKTKFFQYDDSILQPLKTPPPLKHGLPMRWSIMMMMVMVIAGVPRREGDATDVVDVILGLYLSCGGNSLMVRFFERASWMSGSNLV